MTFQLNDPVEILPHRSKDADGTVKRVLARVTNPHDPTDMVRINGEPVGFYVRVALKPGGPELGYHEQSLRLITAI